MKAFFGIFLGIFIVLFYHPTKIIAHDEVSDWISINGDFTIISDSTAPKTSALKITPHFINKQFQSLEEIEFKVNLEEIQNKYVENIDLIDWIFSDGKRFRGEVITTNFFEGSYFLKISFIANDNVVDSEEISFNVGELPLQSHILVNEESIDSSTLQIDRNNEYIFSISEINEGYLYQWDIGDGKAYFGDKLKVNFRNSNLPLYLAQRTFSEKGVYEDQFIRIDSDDSPIFKVQKPPVKNNENVEATNVDALLASSQAALLFSTIFFTIIIIIKFSIRAVKRR